MQSRKITIEIRDYHTKLRSTRSNHKKMNPFCFVQLGPHKTFQTPVVAKGGKQASWNYIVEQQKLLNMGKGITFEVRDQDGQTAHVIGATPKYSLQKLLQNDDKEICPEKQV